MINTYSYLETQHSKLHWFVMAFFIRIEYETGEFSDDFFEEEFYNNIIKHHPKLLLRRFETIYNEIASWKQDKRSKFCKAILASNDIRSICEGKEKAIKISKVPIELRQTIEDLFKSLYEDVLKGSDWYKKYYGNLLDHYHDLKKHASNDYEYCPACGIVPMKGITEHKRDQYDHYLAKDIYPFSSVNFKNLVPICTDCNSLEVKSAKDVLSYSGTAFYPFEENHKAIEIEVVIEKNDLNKLDKIQWRISYSTADKKNKQIEAWKQIYNIETRHQPHITSHINRWYKSYFDFMNDADSKSDIPDDTKRKNSYLRTLKNKKVLEYKVLDSLLNTVPSNTKSEIRKYSMFK